MYSGWTKGGEHDSSFDACSDTHVRHELFQTCRLLYTLKIYDEKRIVIFARFLLLLFTAEDLLLYFLFFFILFISVSPRKMLTILASQFLSVEKRRAWTSHSSKRKLIFSIVFLPPSYNELLLRPLQFEIQY